MLIDAIIILIGLITIGFIYVKSKYSYWSKRNIPNVKPKFPEGNVPGFFSMKPTAIKFSEYYQQFKNKSPLVGIFMFLRPAVIICDMELVKTILIKDFSSFMDRGIFYNEKDDPLSAHLFSIDGGPKWKQLRSKLTPTFTSGKMKMMFPTIVSVAHQMTDYLRKSKETELEMQELLIRFTTDVIGTCAFGLDCNSINDPETQFRVMGRKIFHNSRFRSFLNLFKFSFIELARKLHLKALGDEVSNFFLKVVEDTVKFREDKKIERNDFMNLLIEMKNSGNSENSLTMNEIAAQSFVFFVAGFETSSTALTFAIYELCQNQDVQEKGRQEIKNVLAKHNGEMTYEAVMEMKYVEQIINESLRKYPPLPNLMRVLTRDYKVPNTEHILEKGTQIIIPAYGIQHDPEFYPEPEKFNPDRFSHDENQKRNPLTFLAFGEGPRNCIGLRFGMLQAKIGLASLLLNHKFSNSEKTPIPLMFAAKKVFLAPNDGLWINIEKIN